VKHTSYRRSLISRCLLLSFFCSLAEAPLASTAASIVQAVTLVSLSQLTMGSAHAQEAAEPPAYRSVVREALAEYTAKNFPEAQALFAEAHRLYPNARTLRGLGMTAFELRSYRESIGYLNEALSSQVKPLDGALRAETERLLARAERFVGKLNLEVNPASAEVLLDGNPIQVVVGTPLVLEVGEHALEFRAEGYSTETRSLYVKGREVETWTVVLNKQPAQAVGPVAPAPAEVAQRAELEQVASPRYLEVNGSDDRRSKQPAYKNPWLWTGVGVAVVAIVVTSVLLATRDKEIGRAQVGDNTPTSGGVFSALEGAP
jgi:tetratricopeptide (TPR) repeat protein